MATTIADARPPRLRVNLAPTLFDKFLGYAAAALFLAVTVAVVRGRDEIGALPVFLQGHIATMWIALLLTPVMMLRRRGDRLHRRLGWVWATCLVLTAVLTFGIRGINNGSLWFIHLLSVLTLVQVPRLVLQARRHDVAAHRGTVRGIVTGALLIAGFFTFPGGRLMGQWLLG